MAALMASGNYAFAQGSDKMKVGLIGCGGRGTQAAEQAVTSSPNMELVALCDLFRDQIDKTAKVLKESLGEKYRVKEDCCFTGFDGYKGVIAQSDYVLMATSPGFRPMHLRATVEAGKHAFIEKPVAVDAPGVRSVIESGEMARQKGLGIVAGTQYRYQPSYIEAIKRVHDGQIGDVAAMQIYFNTASLWLRPRQPSWSDMEWQTRNWYYFTWLSGDHIVEQHVHNIDNMCWVMKDHPSKAIGMGGRQVRIQPEYGHIYDHFTIEYDFPNGVKVTSMSRQQDNTATRVMDRIVGSRGVATLNGLGQPGKITGEKPWRYDGEFPNPYVLEHAALIRSVREGKPINEAKQVAESTLAGILGREAAYTGQEITWDQMLNCSTVLGPSEFKFGPLPTPPVAMPGKTKLERPPLT
jgi:myo-inositol 2-dehydrogenase / D-chiro-inositol 1-dehydrogenase